MLRAQAESGEGGPKAAPVAAVLPLSLCDENHAVAEKTSARRTAATISWKSRPPTSWTAFSARDGSQPRGAAGQGS